jgi:hypothetical protein
MAKVNLSGMTVEALMDLRKRVDEMLLEHRAEIEQQLERMDRTIAVVGHRRVDGRSALKGRKFRRNIGVHQARLGLAVAILLALTMPASAQTNPQSTANEMLSGMQGPYW